MRPADLLDDLEAAEERLARTVASLDETTMGQPSILPGWSRAHVLTHLARNADAMRNFVLAARAGTHVDMYASRPLRTADIEAGTTRAAELIALDAVAAGRRTLLEFRTVPDELWDTTVTIASGGIPSVPVRLRATARMRLHEVEIHHTDLHAGYDFSRTPSELRRTLLRDTIRSIRGNGFAASIHPDDGDPSEGEPSAPVVRGSEADLLAWLLGRTRGPSLRTDADSLPPVPAM